MLPVRVVCFGISGTVALTGGTGCWALTDNAVSMPAARPATKNVPVFLEFSL